MLWIIHICCVEYTCKHSLRKGQQFRISERLCSLWFTFCVQCDRYLARVKNICLPEIWHSFLWHNIRLSSWVISGGNEDSINRRIFSPACSLSFSCILTNPSSLASRNTFRQNQPLEKEKQINRRLEKVEYKLGEPFQAQWSVRNRPLFFSPFKLL